MATWRQFEVEAPELAAAGRALWEQHGLMYLATVRTDGAPRVHPVVPLLAAGGIFVAIAERSPKWRDLRREPRCVLHALPGSRDDEFTLRCHAREEPNSRETVRAAANHVIHDDDHVFVFEIEQADLGWWVNVGQSDLYSVRTRWTQTGGVREVHGPRPRRHERG